MKLYDDLRLIRACNAERVAFIKMFNFIFGPLFWWYWFPWIIYHRLLLFMSKLRHR